jgi:hypothetical protein
VIARSIDSEAKQDHTLALYLLTIARHESSYTRTVHIGHTRGDNGRSWGIYQMMCGARADAKVPGTDYTARDIVGVDSESTDRATEVAALWLRGIISRCKGSSDCVFRAYGGVSKTATGPVADRIRARVATFNKLRREFGKALK